MASDCDSDEPEGAAFDWESVPADPDLEEDLGYRIGDMDVVETNNGSGQLLFLPWDEEMVHDASFIVAGPESVVNLLDER